MLPGCIKPTPEEKASSFDPIELGKQIWRFTENPAFFQSTGSLFPRWILKGNWPENWTEALKINGYGEASQEKSGLFSDEKPTAAKKF